MANVTFFIATMTFRCQTKFYDFKAQNAMLSIR